MEALRAKKTIGAWTIAVIVIFVVMAVSIYGIAKKTYDDMSEAAIQNLNENLNLMGNTVEAIMRSEAEFQLLTAEEIAQAKDPQGYIRSLRTSESASKFSFVPHDQEQGISNDGETFDPSTLVFPEGSSVLGLELSQTYVNYQGVWAYTMKCPVERAGQNVGTLYVEYDFGAIAQSLPKGFYDKQAVLYLMDTASERFVMKPEGMGGARRRPPQS